MPILVLVAYKPKLGQDAILAAEVREHVPILQRLGLATSRMPIIGKAGDGTFVEMFEWVSKEAIENAHKDPTVLAMWGRFGACCDCIPIGQVPEASQLFSHFTPFS